MIIPEYLNVKSAN
ncbi:unnamed protein product [Larinioides sclopetarius]|uniref:Uncharacterized protein n=1 Tax=Larinioides sclopetarius TaxID=280406 RepID=A0AAV1ZJW3_9ARAC